MENKKQNNGYSHILKYTGLFGGVQLFYLLVGVIRNKLAALLLGPTGIGLISLFNSTVKLVFDATNLGFPVSAVKNISETYESGDTKRLKTLIATVRLWGVITAVAGLILCIALSPLLDSFTFSWGSHTLHYMLLSPVVALMVFTGIEMAILKGTRHLRNLATISIASAFFTLLTAIPLYWLIGIKGVVPSLLLAALAQMVLTICYSYKHFPLQIHYNRSYLRSGMDMVKLGFAFVLAGVLGSGADFIIRSYLNHSASTDVVGFYNAGYLIVMSYAGMVFTSMETDYFPRLSAANNDREMSNLMVNRQMEVSMLIVAPMVVGLLIGLPIIIPLLYSHLFMPTVEMVQVSVLSLYMRSMTLSMSYMTLAKADSLSYLFLEMIYDVVLVILVIWGFQNYGLVGAGIGLLAAAVIDFIVIHTFVSKKYGFRMNHGMKLITLIHIPIGLLAFVLTHYLHGTSYWLTGIVLVSIDTALSYYLYNKRKNTPLK